eukprot:TRINITY_DN4981_c0_g1_i1.p1 TRINITY_DN4981_c0_g1~~TRINITY_DN4981_c0_g1_i1.p1  ORF type:complete len:243 (-),score=65.28 TRINITY_DN4981_c0_g1_i1:77-718(-)
MDADADVEEAGADEVGVEGHAPCDEEPPPRPQPAIDTSSVSAVVCDSVYGLVAAYVQEDLKMGAELVPKITGMVLAAHIRRGSAGVAHLRKISTSKEAVIAEVKQCLQVLTAESREWMSVIANRIFCKVRHKYPTKADKITGMMIDGYMHAGPNGPVALAELLNDEPLFQAELAKVCTALRAGDAKGEKAAAAATATAVPSQQLPTAPTVATT